ncbi:VWA domain-containing protein [Idiomarina xiamenensis]|uniref:von Willebrand factor A n=1 Tax=Idiomarina xiamenensis 10-D-4 TaxID=740709 RepID=K2JZ21_9GAMM|nr:VWA domain-containing protein [Idiomarina xiamenensis]EKE80638.1 von Willebrand factor A [Idiomarina xiamenensis 10-D-4]
MSKRTPIEVFSLSFLDVISCAFGAVVMLILLAKNGDEGDFRDANQVSTLIQSIAQAQQQSAALQQAFADKLEQLQQMQAAAASNAEQAEALQSAIARAKNNVQQLTDAASGLEQTLVERERAALNAGRAETRDEAVGGVPVDSDYVVFIIDTSGSMRQLWPQVMRTMQEVLNNHPDVKGFQVMSDNGDVLGQNHAGGWRKDSKAQRAGVLQGMRSWSGASNSSPVEGIELALKSYRRYAGNLALYVFGDDYAGRSYEAAATHITALNNDGNGGQIARIHGIGFKKRGFDVNPRSEVVKFSTLMREVAQRNNGTFMGL